MNKGFSYKAAESLVKVFSNHGVEYLFIGKSGAILYGFPDTTQDVDIFPRKDIENGKKIVSALRELGFEIDGTLEAMITEGKDFIQIRSTPFDIDLVFAPDGIASFEKAKEKANLIDGRFPVLSLGDIIASKKASGRKKDLEALDRLTDFYNFLKKSQSA